MVKILPAVLYKQWTQSLVIISSFLSNAVFLTLPGHSFLWISAIIREAKSIEEQVSYYKNLTGFIT